MTQPHVLLWAAGICTGAYLATYISRGREVYRDLLGFGYEQLHLVEDLGPIPETIRSLW